MVLAHAGGSGWDEWMYLAAPLGFYAVCVLALVVAGRSSERNLILAFFRRISDSLHRLTGFPGWSMAGVLSGLQILLIAVTGFYWDVAWHIDFGRDDQLFTPSHVMILVGLGGLVYAAIVAVIFATLDRAETGMSVFGLRIPWSALTLAVMGVGGVVAFPLDNLWHEAYGIDVTLWSPTHLQLVAGGSLATIALWLMLAEALPQATPTRVGRFLHVLVAGTVLVGMSTFQGEFDFGAPQFQVLYHPVLIMAAAGFALVLARAALGPGGAIKAIIAYLVIRGCLAMVLDGALNHTVPRFPLYLPSAVAVEAAAWFTRGKGLPAFALAAGGLTGTVGLAGELLWIKLSGWGEGVSLPLPTVTLLSLLAAAGAAMLGVGLARAMAKDRQPIPQGALVLAGVGLLAALAFPLPRDVGKAEAVIRLLNRSEGRADVQVELHPGDAAHEANIFTVTSWQGGGSERAPLERVGAGRYATSRSVPINGSWKSMVTLQRGDEVMAAPIYLPPDPAIGAPAVRALPERRVAFVRNTDLLLREAHEGPAWPAVVAYGALAALVALWVWLMGLTARRAALSPGPTSGPESKGEAKPRSAGAEPGPLGAPQWTVGGWHSSGRT